MEEKTTKTTKTVKTFLFNPIEKKVSELVMCRNMKSRLKIIGGPRQDQNLGPLQTIHFITLLLTFYSLGN